MPNVFWSPSGKRPVVMFFRQAQECGAGFKPAPLVFAVYAGSSCLDDAFRRAYPHACRSVAVSDALGARRRIDNIGVVTGRNCVDRAFGFARSAEGA